jgi:hypothetical protein
MGNPGYVKERDGETALVSAVNFDAHLEAGGKKAEN